jgi:hypothetical protein
LIDVNVKNCKLSTGVLAVDHMSLPVLAALVVGGIGFIVLVIHLSGGTKNAHLASAEAAVARFAEDFPEEETGRVVLASDGSAAFLALSNGRTGIVQAFGNRFLTRIHKPGDDRVDLANDISLTISTGEFAWTGGRYAFADAADRDFVASRLTASAGG